MKQPVFGRGLLLLLMGWMFASGPVQAADANLAVKATAILNVNCHRCHGQDGTSEGGINYMLDTAKLIARKKVIPGQAEQSPLFKRSPPARCRRPANTPGPPRPTWPCSSTGSKPASRRAAPVASAGRHRRGRGRVDPGRPRSREKRAAAAFTATSRLTALANAGPGPMSCSPIATPWPSCSTAFPGIRASACRSRSIPTASCCASTLRNYQWDANLWNRLLADYPYGILNDSGIGRAVMVATATRMPYVRARLVRRHRLAGAALLRPAANADQLSELERQLRVDVAVDIQQERVARPDSSAPASRATTASGAARRPERRLLAHLRLRRHPAKPHRPRPVAARPPQHFRLSARPRIQRQHLPARRRRSYLQLAQRLHGYYAGQRQQRPPRQGQRPPSSAIRNGPTGRSRPACRACRAMPAASCKRPTRSAITSARTRSRSAGKMPT